jgi:predicted alpha/beta-fold hydrolase
MPGFIPHPLFRSGHHQTIVGYLLRNWQRDPGGILRKVPLSDGDALHVYDTVPPLWQPGGPVAVIVHGLGGSHLSGSVLRLTWELLPRQVRILRVNLRGCGTSMADCRHPYHAGCSADISQALTQAQKWFPGSPLWLIGISLGGNIVLKVAAETLAADFPALQRIVAIAPPVDLHRCTRLLQLPENRRYETRFVRELHQLAQARARQHGQPMPSFPPKLKLSEFDDQYTAPRCGFLSGADYYARASSGPLLPAITIPTDIITATDDPFIDCKPLRGNLPESIRVHLTENGGHLGYISRPRHGGWCWLERFVTHLLCPEPSPAPVQVG